MTINWTGITCEGNGYTPIDGGGASPTLSVATFADLAALSPVDGEYVVVTTGLPYFNSVVRWSSKNSRWELHVSLYASTTPSGDEIYNSGGVLVKAIIETGLVDSMNSSGYYWNGATWVVLKDITPVATFGNLPVGVLGQQAIVLDNGFLSPSFVAFDGVNWVVTTTRVAAFGNLPVDGVWNLSPSVVSDTDTVVSDNSPPAIYWNWDGAAWVEYTEPPKYTIATFSELPSNAAVGQRVTVTGESGLSKLIVINTAANTWEVGTVSTDYPTYSAIEWGTVPGEWYNAGGIVVTTSSGCIVMDAINKISFYWDAVNTMFVPLEVLEGTIASVKKIKGDSTTPTDWVKVETPGSGTAVISTSGGVLSLTTTQPSVSGAATASLTLTDASLSSASNVYLKAMARVTTLTGNNCRANFAINDGTDAYDFGSARVLGAAYATGQWFDPTNTTAYTAQSGAQLDLSSAMVLLEMQKTATRCMARVAGGIWVDITGATVRNAGATTITVTTVCNTNGSGTAAATLDIQHLAYMRY